MIVFTCIALLAVAVLLGWLSDRKDRREYKPMSYFDD